MPIDKSVLWTVMPLIAAGTYLIRFSFLGILGSRPLPGWLRRMLRYTAVAVLPGLVAPAVLWPAATGGVPDAARLAAAVVTLGVGTLTRNVLGAMVAGAATLYTVLWLTG